MGGCPESNDNNILILVMRLILLEHQQHEFGNSGHFNPGEGGLHQQYNEG